MSRVLTVTGGTTGPSVYEKLFVDHVMQADEGIDFEFLAGGKRGGRACATALLMRPLSAEQRAPRAALR